MNLYESIRKHVNEAEVPTSEISDKLKELWSDPNNSLSSGQDYIDYFAEKYNWHLTSDELNHAWDIASNPAFDDEQEDEGIEINGEYFSDASDAGRWLNKKISEYGNTHHFSAEDNAVLNKLISKFGNTYFWK